MRLVHVAKILGMTGQELRKELMQVDFGIKPTDREVPQNLAMGVIRFVANKKGLKIDMDSIQAGGMDDEKEDAEEQEEKAASSEPATAVPKTEGLNVLRKLTLDDVPVLYEYHKKGLIDFPKYLPRKFADLNGLSVWMAFSAFLNKMKLDTLSEKYKNKLAG